MTEFENDLRRRLADAAQLAPAYRPATAEGAPRTARRGPLVLGGLVAAGVAVAAGTLWWLPGGEGGQGDVATTEPGVVSRAHGHALCPATLVLDGRTYSDGEWTRLPRAGVSLGTAPSGECPGRDVRETREVFAADGFAPESVVLTEDDIWSTDPAVPGLDRLTTPVRCTGATAFTATGTLDDLETTDGNDGPVIGTDLTLTGGPRWLMADDAAVRVRAAVTARTSVGPVELGPAVRSGTDQVTAELRCTDGAFEAVALTLTQ